MFRLVDAAPWLATACVEAASAVGRPPSNVRRTGNAIRSSGERCINRLKQWRRIATRHEKTARVYRAGLLIAGIFPWSAH